jgi:hypothetical protein
MERLFRHLKERTVVFHHKISARNHITGNKQPKTIPKPIHTLLSSREDGEVSKNAYLDTIKSLSPKTLMVKGLKEWGRGRLGHPRSIWEAL